MPFKNELAVIVVPPVGFSLHAFGNYRANSGNKQRQKIVDGGEFIDLQNALRMVRYPSGINRVPRPLAYRNNYKASELMHLFLYSFPMFFRMRDPKSKSLIHPKLRRWILGLSIGLNLLLADTTAANMTANETIQHRSHMAELLFKEFLMDATSFFGQNLITYNFHQLLHLPQNYRDFGPLYEVSAFPHEGNLGLMKSMLYGRNTDLLDKEICNKYALQIRLAEILSKGCRNRRAQFTSRSKSREVLSPSSKSALEVLIGDLDDFDGTVDVYERGYLADGSSIAVGNPDSDTAERCDFKVLHRNNNIVELLHLVETTTAAGDESYAIVRVIASPESPQRWTVDLKTSQTVIYPDRPLVFVEKPQSAQRIIAVPIGHLVHPVISQKSNDEDSNAVRLLDPSFAMPRN